MIVLRRKKMKKEIVAEAEIILSVDFADFFNLTGSKNIEIYFK